MKRPPVILAAVAMVLGLATAATPAASAATTQACPITANPVARCVITPAAGFGTVDVAARGADPGIPWAASDHTGALMGFLNLYELASVGDGGKDPGGMLCSTYKLKANIACFTPTGNLILQATGPAGPVGPARVLTPRKLGQLLALLDAGLTPRDVVWIHAQGG